MSDAQEELNQEGYAALSGQSLARGTVPYLPGDKERIETVILVLDSPANRVHWGACVEVLRRLAEGMQ
jgi:hypothetical protein